MRVPARVPTCRADRRAKDARRLARGGDERDDRLGGIDGARRRARRRRRSRRGWLRRDGTAERQKDRVAAAALKRSRAAVTRAGALAGECAATERAALLGALPPGEFLSCPLCASRRFFRIYRALSPCHRVPSSPRIFRSHSGCFSGVILLLFWRRVVAG